MNKKLLGACRRLVAALMACAAVPAVQAATDLSQTPISLGGSVPPLNMIVLGRDHKLYYEAYNDASDLDGDGKLDIRFDPSITYYGYFDSSLCYRYSSGIFTPSAQATGGACSSAWHGNFMNYLTTARIDALRKVLYGGKRYIDTATRTVLERTHIPQDAHSWGKEYKSIAEDGYDIRNYTPLGLPTSGTRHLFASVTPSGTEEPPLMRVLQNSAYRAWEWVSIERLVAGSECDNGTGKRNCGTITDYAVRVEVCTADFHDNDCRLYPAGNYKPAGLIQQYGEDDSMMFGLISGSYAKNKSGGVLRKPVGSITSEIDLQNGTFRTAAGSLGLIASVDRLRTRGFNWDTYDCGWVTTRPINDGECRMWGNPVGEMMYEGLRYFAGKASPTSAFSIAASGNDDATLGLPLPAWDDPYDYQPDAGTGFPWCAKPFMLVISDMNVSYDSDQLPGSAFGSFSGSLDGLDVQSEAATITASEPDVAGSRFIGEVDGSTSDSAPTPKTVSSLGRIRGLPEEPTKQGSYYSGAVARFGKTHDLHEEAEGDQSTDTFVVALSSPLPKIEMPIGSGSNARTVTLVPFAKSVSGGGIDGTRGRFQPTNQIVDFYVKQIVNTNDGNGDSTVNGGRPYGKFSINFEDVEQGADHDMDAIVDYEIKVNADNTVTVSLDSVYAASGIQQHIGYVMSGTTQDGIYLDVVAKGHQWSPYKYFLDTPAGCWPEADGSIPETTVCQAALGLTATRTFTAGTSAGGYLKDPLWYAAKWGGYNDLNKNGRLDAGEWDADEDGTPDSYFLVTNPLKLRDQLEQLFSDISDRSSSGSAVSISGTWQRSDTTVYQARFYTGDWSGHLDAFPLGNDGTLGTVRWDAATRLDDIAPAQRTILTWDPDEQEGVPFRWADLTSTQQAQLFTAPETATTGQSRLAYLRGDRSLEQGNTNGVFRTRSTVLGDIVNSSPVYLGAPQMVLPEATFGGYAAFKTANRTRAPVVYVGANDGMLHGFSAATGDEVLAFVPNAIFGNLSRLTDPDYSHRTFVDGTIATGDIKSGNAWQTILVSGLGAGGKSLFALDVTDPSRFSETRADALVKWEMTDAGLGNVLAKPQIAYLENDTWGVIVGSGYNGGSPASIYILDADTGEVIKRIPVAASSGTTTFTDNGIGAVEVIDADGDFKADTVYAGDLYGNVWKFDLSGSSSSSWDVAYRSGGRPVPMYVARGPTGLRQPITTKPVVMDHPLGEGSLVFVGTGRFLGSSDVSSSDVQSIHAVWDKGTYLSNLNRTVLLQQSILYDDTDTFTHSDMRVTTNLPITWFSSNSSRALPSNPAEEGYMGWYLDLDSENDVGERIHQNMFIRNDRLVAVSVTPNTDPCDGGGKSWIYELNAFSGSRLTQTPFDYNSDGDFDSEDMLPSDSGARTIGSGIRVGTGIYYMNEDSVHAGEKDDDKLPSTSQGEVLSIGESRGRGMWRTWTEITR